MGRYGIVGQTAWFVFGTWMGASFWQLLEVVHRREFKVRSPLNDGYGLPSMIILFLPISIVLGLIFAAWLWFRSRQKRISAATPWVAPLIAGLLFFPSFGAMIPVLCILCGQSQGAIIGTAVVILIFGGPVVFAEICLRMSRRPAQHNQ